MPGFSIREGSTQTRAVTSSSFLQMFSIPTHKNTFFIDAVTFCFCHGTLKRMWPFQECWSSLARGRQEKDLDSVKPLNQQWAGLKFLCMSGCRDGTNFFCRPHCQYYSCPEILVADDLVKEMAFIYWFQFLSDSRFILDFFFLDFNKRHKRFWIKIKLHKRADNDSSWVNVYLVHGKTPNYINIFLMIVQKYK